MVNLTDLLVDDNLAGEPVISDDNRPPETEIREKIRQEFSGRVVTTRSGSKAHIESVIEEDKPICHLGDKCKNPNGKPLSVFPFDTIEFCTACVEIAFPDASNRCVSNIAVRRTELR